MENLTDRQAAEAVQVRIDWKYALGLALEDEGFDYSVLSEFRSRLMTKGAEAQIFDKLLEVCKGRGLVKAGGKQRTDSTQVLAAVRELNRLECVGETVRQALEALVDVMPDWFKGWLKADWMARYSQPLNSYRLPKEKKARAEMGLVIGWDGCEVLTQVYAVTAPRWLREVPALETLRRIWIQQYEELDGQLHWRDDKDLPPAHENAIFAQIKSVNEEADASETMLRISCDAKAVVKIGEFSRLGNSRVNVRAADKDFRGDEVVIPYGIFLPKYGALSLNLCRSKATADFIVDCLGSWWHNTKASRLNVVGVCWSSTGMAVC